MADHTTSAGALTFHETAFDIVDLHDQPWLRGWQIASALGYGSPRADIANLFDRNAAEFTPDMTQVVDLPTAGGVQQVRIFSLRGAHLLGMLARTERAVEFRRWVLDVLEGREAPQPVVTMSYAQTLAYLKERRGLLRELATATHAGTARELHANLSRISRTLGMPLQALKDLAPGLQQLPLSGEGGAA